MDSTRPGQLLVIPCSGIGKVHGLMSREAMYSSLDALPGKIDTVCLALLVQGEPETRERVRQLPSITVDGCPKLCAQKNVELAGGTVVQGVRVYETLKQHRGEDFGTVTALTSAGLAVADEIGGRIAEVAQQTLDAQTEADHG